MSSTTSSSAPAPGAVVLPEWALDYVAHLPGGAHPSYAHSYSVRDNDFYRRWDAISSDRDTFRRWLDEHVLTGATESGGIRR